MIFPISERVSCLYILVLVQLAMILVQCCDCRKGSVVCCINMYNYVLSKCSFMAVLYHIIPALTANYKECRIWDLKKISCWYAKHNIIYACTCVCEKISWCMSVYIFRIHVYTYLEAAMVFMMCGLLWWQCGGSSVTPFQLHIWIAKCAPTWCSSIEIQPCDTSGVALTTEVQPIEVWLKTAIVPPCSLVWHCTVTTEPVIVSVMSREWHAIIVTTGAFSHAVPCCPYPPVLVPSNSESVVGTWSAHMKIVITGILGLACKVSKVNS